VVIENLDDKLSALAKKHGRSIEEEICEILENAVLETTLHDLQLPRGNLHHDHQ
jgi:plasmid stability protein